MNPTATYDAVGFIDAALPLDQGRHLEGVEGGIMEDRRGVRRGLVAVHLQQDDPVVPGFNLVVDGGIEPEWIPR